jgi:NADH-quinone oxidoreductase subunit E
MIRGEHHMVQVDESKQEKMRSGFSNFKVELWKYQGEMGALIPLLQSAQETYGYIPESAIDLISQIVGIPAADIYGVITFYSQFRLKPMGRNIIKICDGTACHVNASSTIIKTIEGELKVTNDETTDDGMFTLQKVACLGCCSLSPVVMINDETHGRLTPKKVKQLLKEYRERSQE